MKLSVLTDEDSWFRPYAEDFAAELGGSGHDVDLVFSPAELNAGDIAFFLSLSQLVRPALLELHTSNIVVHASDLPRGKGWSPVTWQVLEGADSLPFSLFEAVEAVDAGPIYLRTRVELSGTELVTDLREIQARETLRLCRQFVNEWPGILDRGEAQDPSEESFYARRRPADSLIDPSRSVIELFDALRVADPDRYPAYFTYRGERFELILRRSQQD